ERGVHVFRTIGSPGFPFDEDGVRRLAALSFDRGFNPDGVARQLIAIIASGSRVSALETLNVPALVIHGIADPLVPLAGGEDTAHSIPNARLVRIEGMGHDMPIGIWPELLDGICSLTQSRN